MKQIIVPAQLDQFEAVMDFLVSNMCQAELDAKLQSQLALVIEEIFVNIASYAYPAGGGEVTIRFFAGSDKIALEFSDEGIEYNPLIKEDPDVSLPAEEREIGGLGIYLVKQIMDDTEYRREGSKNILFIEKRLH